ncbi:cell division protein [Ahniella affigens]|uniref:Peptidoglycan D,D-transpeptidase FtsI n=1 Tax=Ahniella affigens TaxID=2021234 RepID=A0A2P1PM52_9GAMM|nr:penicillin-binding transpeptidase domain-containing protein [Ahniella affigens]AVP95912.1 cell division protein [Ahniella affigens]
MRNLRAEPIRDQLRLTALGVFLALCGVGLFARAAYMQVATRDFYQDQGDARFLREVPIAATRGDIVDRNGEPLAISTPMVSLWVHPKSLAAAPERIPELAALLKLDTKDLTQQITERADREFMYLRRRMPPDVADAVLEKGIPGVNGMREFRRFYPSGEVFAHVVGTTNVDDRGQEGLERLYDTWLLGVPGSKRVIRDRLGRVVESIEELRAAKPGSTLQLSLDRRIQYLAHRELKAAIFEHSASSGSMVILDVPTGEVLAMANYPSFNPNAVEPDQAVRRNRAVTDLFEPGSVVKAFTVSAGLESGKFKVDTLIDTHPGTLMVANHLVRDVRDFGIIDPTRLLTKSSNVAATKIALELDNAHLVDMFARFGFGQATGSQFPGEVSGYLPAAEGLGLVEKATLSYGYGLSVNALQLAQSYAALANQGRFRPATFIHRGNEQVAERAILDPEIASQVLGMLETVTGPGGSGIKAVVPNYRVAGKTGTAKRAVRGGYEKSYVSVFAGIVPVSHPRLAAVVVINDPRGQAYYGGQVAAPVFGRVMDDALRLLNVPPDNLDAQQMARNSHPPGVSEEALAVNTDFAEGVAP